MATIRRANVILEISDDEAVIQKYLSMGFDVVDNSGEIIKKSTHGKSESELRIELEKLQKKYDEAQKEIKDLKGKLDAMVEGMKDAEVDPEVPVEAPKKRRNTKKVD